MLILQNLSYTHPSKDVLFSDVSLTIQQHDKLAIVGNNGVGKSTLLKLIAGQLTPSHGCIIADAPAYYVPQHFGQYDHLTIAQALQVEDKLQALYNIINGDVSEQQLTILNDDWTIEERCHEALQHWQLQAFDLHLPMSNLSGGQKTKVFLAGIYIHQPQLILMDEPSNHLDVAAREALYHFIQHTNATLVIVSHDRKLLNMIDTIAELSSNGITTYGGNYEFYMSQKEAAAQALQDDVRSKEKALRKAKEKERETIERQQKLDARGKKKQEKAGLPTISMNTFRNNAEKSTAKTKGVHEEKIAGIAQELQALRAILPDIDQMQFGFDNAALHKGKILFTATAVNYRYQQHWLWMQPLTLQITSGERIALKGNNGSGKTTLIQIILGRLTPQTGQVQHAINNAVYIDQEYTLINNLLSVYQQAQQYNNSGLQEHEIKSRLNRFLFTQHHWDKPCSVLSGGEKMRLMLCCLNISHQSPDMIILDEPTNNLDIQNIAILTSAINSYEGTLIVVSHDEVFLKEVRIGREVQL